MRIQQSQRGFTLIEMIVVIVITGIIAGMVAMFLRAPVQGYVDSARRAEMTDIADTALRRIAREMRTAVPNSVRLPSATGSFYIEFLPTTDGGRYRVSPTGGAACAASALGDALSFDGADNCFGIIGAPVTTTAGDAVVIGSTQSDGSQPYQAVNSATGVRRMVSAAGTTTVQVTSGTKLPASAELDGHRFEVVPAAVQAVTYACETLGTDANGDGTGTLTRYWGYGFIADPTKAVPPAFAGKASGPVSALLADKVSACSFDYDTAAGNARNSLVAVSLTITRGGESIRLYHEIHINNIP
jgi:MSHA biogenesis protein MshO